MKKRVLCYGDSNTWAYDAVNGGRFDENSRWTALLQKNLGEDYMIIEEGLCGRTNVFDDPLYEGLNGLTYLYPCMMSHDPLDYMILMLGTNDCKERFSATPKNIADGMRRLAVKAIETPVWRKKPQILIVSPAPIEPEVETSPVAGEMGNCVERSRGLAKEYRFWAEQLGLKFWDAGEIATMNKVDFMHFDGETHRRFADKVTEIIKNWNE